MPKIKKITYINSLLVAIIIIYAAYSHFIGKLHKNVVYVENMRVFNEFNMTRQMKGVGEKELNLKTKFIDSLYSALNTSLDDEQKKDVMQRIIYEKQEIENFNQNFPATQSEKVWNRISSYAKEFSEKNNYEIILGAQPDVNVLYGSESINVTDNFILYINTKYEGVK